MDKIQIAFYAGEISRQIEFIPGSEVPWIPLLADDDAAELKWNGIYDGKPAMLQVIPLKNYSSADDNQRTRPEIEYEKNRLPGAVKLPHRLGYGYRNIFDNIVYFVWYRPKGERIIPMDMFIAPLPRFSDGNPVWEKINEFNKLVEATESTLQKAFGQQGQTTEGKMPILLYFIRRWEKWLTYPESHGVGNEWGVSNSEATRTLSKILKPIWIFENYTYWSFNLFGNTDIVKTQEGQYYLINGRFEQKPAGFLYAAFLWNLLMYSYKKSPKVAIGDLRSVFHYMTGIDALLKPEVRMNFLERFFATCNIDTRYQRSPLDKITKEEFNNFAKILQENFYFDDKIEIV